MIFHTQQVAPIAVPAIHWHVVYVMLNILQVLYIKEAATSVQDLIMLVSYVIYTAKKDIFGRINAQLNMQMGLLLKERQNLQRIVVACHSMQVVGYL